ncbi:hypothetical protein BD779DRAFT_619868 [Infundibulicybe gibba]|nr:hypothetical protein BD779DRAFT_619868 [Infundibulicybe gibba]
MGLIEVYATACLKQSKSHLGGRKTHFCGSAPPSMDGSQPHWLQFIPVVETVKEEYPDRSFHSLLSPPSTPVPYIPASKTQISNLPRRRQPQLSQNRPRPYPISRPDGRTDPGLMPTSPFDWDGASRTAQNRPNTSADAGGSVEVEPTTYGLSHGISFGGHELSDGLEQRQISPPSHISSLTGAMGNLSHFRGHRASVIRDVPPFDVNMNPESAWWLNTSRSYIPISPISKFPSWWSISGLRLCPS